LIFSSDELSAIAEWAATAEPLKGDYYRSVEYRYMDQQEVLSGRGAALYGGRFASVGTRAAFLADSDSAASGSAGTKKTPRRQPSDHAC
jgi:RES domain-containing protein